MKKFLLLTIFGFFISYISFATTYTVNSTSDANTGSGTTGTLRWCIGQANAASGADIINFSIAGTFTVATNYPTIIYPVTINGYSAPGAVQGQLGTGARGTMKVILNGPGNNTVYGFQITGNNCVISGLVIQNFYKGILINGGDNNWIWGCYIGTSADGLSISASTTCYDDGIALTTNANNNIIGTNGDNSNDANEGNLISGNGDGAQFLGEGISINQGGAIGQDCTGNTVAGNYLGTNETGTAALYSGSATLNGQRGSGVQVEYSTANIIGTDGDGVSDALERNIISGNSDCGIVFIGGSGNKVKGNYIGTTKTGLVALPNYANGGTNIVAVQISIKTGSNNNFIGTDGDGSNDNIEGNVIGSISFAAGSSNSYNYAVFVSGCTGTRIAGNKIGIGADGVTALNIKTTGATYIDKAVYISGASTSTIVGTNGDGVSDSYEANYIGNTAFGVTIDNSNSCIIAGNYFGLGTNLTTFESFTSDNTVTPSCIYILNSTSVRVGSSASNSLEKNYMCKAAIGVWVDGNSTSHNDLINIRYNTMGIRPDGVAAGNSYAAVGMYKESNADTVQYNIISQNGGITPYGDFGAITFGYTDPGDDEQNNVIKGNTIYKNIGPGIQILNSSSTGNLITQNSIYNNGNASDATGKLKLGIDLQGDNVTLNDNKDPDAGPNNLSNFPIITAAIKGASSCIAQISGTFNGLPSTQYYIELFTSDVCNGDTAGVDNYSTAGYNYGEGKDYEASSSVFTTDANGNSNWTISFTIGSSSGEYLTAVAVQNSGTGLKSTSEFSQCYWIKADLGDAPDTYHTLLANCGAVHTTGNINLKIGATIDYEDDATPGVYANGDGADEDGLSTLPVLTVKSTTYSLSNIPVTNTTGSTATLYAWIDFNINGSFEASEFASASVANGATTATLTWNLSSFTCGTTLVAGISYLRMRLTTDVLADNVGTTNVDERSYGMASNGEVEDYRISIYGVDYGDLPNTYPTATMICYPDTATAKVWAGATKPDWECTQNYSVDATGDGTEEDGLTTSIGPAGASYNWAIRLNANQAAKTVYYGLWLDWDGNKVFNSGIDAFYSGSAVVTGLTTKNVSVYSPIGIYNSGFRLIVSDAPLTSTMYNATITNGEIEDWLLTKILASPGNILMGNRQGDGNLLKWKNTSALQVTNYIVERSTDNLSWMPLGSVIPLQGNNSSTQYSYSDLHPYAENYYRLKISLSDSSFQYSNIVALVDKNNLIPVIIYPNPATTVLTVQTFNSDYTDLKIYDLTGRPEISQAIISVNTNIDISNLAPGTHLIKFVTKDGEENVQRFVKLK